MDTLLTSPYPQLFHEFILTTLHYVRDRVQRVNGLLPDELRRQALHTLGEYGFDLPVAWPLTRELLLLLAPKLEQAGLRDEWMPYLQRGITRCHATTEAAYQGWFHFHLAVLYEFRARYAQAEEQFAASAACFARGGEQRQQAVAMSRLGFILALQNRYQTAVQLAENALLQLPEKDPARAYAYSTLGVATYAKAEWTIALEHLQNALIHWQAEKNQRQIARALRNLGPPLRQLKRFVEASQCYEQAIVLFDALPDPREAAITRMNLGNIYLETEASAQALTLYEWAEPVLQAYRDDLHLARLYLNRGLAQRNLQQWSAAENALQAALHRWQQLSGQATMVATLLIELMQLYLLQSRHTEAQALFIQAQSQLTALQQEPAYAILQAELLAYWQAGQPAVTSTM